jgi:tetratricopeptide (TPR) repeat protein
MKEMKKPTRQLLAKTLTSLTLTVTMSLSTGCASMRSFLAVGNSNQASGPIHNPFGEVYPGKGDTSQNLILRTKKGDRSVEIELPRSSQEMTDFTIPVSPAFRDQANGQDRAPASSEGSAEDTYKPKPPTLADREITRGFPQGAAQDEVRRREIEQGLGLMASEQDSTPEANSSYLGALDHLKQLYRASRYEAALGETDGLIRQYPTDPKLYQMRGTLLDRVGQTELALKSWNQALRFDPKNTSLKKFVERREQKRSIASP